MKTPIQTILAGVIVISATPVLAQTVQPLSIIHAQSPSSMAVLATDRFEMPTAQYDALSAKLIAAGYRDIRVIDSDTGLMSAFDSDGSEVILQANASTRQITAWNYVHHSDR